MNKELLINNIKLWVKLDNEINTLQQEIKKRKQDKKNISDQLIHVMKENEIDCFDINNGKIIYSTTKQKKPFSKKYLIQCLNDLYGENGDKIALELLEKQEISLKDNIRQKTDKK